ncbi:MAG: hypothetical protein MHPSP_004024, partial [Paramarteilia canceri]
DSVFTRTRSQIDSKSLIEKYKDALAILDESSQEEDDADEHCESSASDFEDMNIFDKGIFDDLNMLFETEFEKEFQPKNDEPVHKKNLDLNENQSEKKKSKTDFQLKRSAMFLYDPDLVEKEDEIYQQQCKDVNIYFYCKFVLVLDSTIDGSEFSS